MPVRGINLLPKEKATPQQKKVIAKITLVLAGILIFYAVLMIGLFAYGSYLSLRNNEIKKESTQTENIIKSVQKKEILELALKTRIKEVSGLLSSRVTYSDYLEKLEALASAGTFFTDFEFQKKAIKAVGSSSNVISVNELIANLKKENLFSQVLMDGLSRGKNGEYGFSLDLTLNNEAKK